LNPRLPPPPLLRELLLRLLELLRLELDRLLELLRVELLRDEPLRHLMRKNAYKLGRGRVWSRVAQLYAKSFEQARQDRVAAETELQLSGSSDPEAERATLQAELDRADVVGHDEVPAGVVTMNSRVRVFDENEGRELVLTLVYPSQADADAGRISVLAPVGSALLGLSVGQSIDWPMPEGRTKTLQILEILYQPEASGDFAS
jgi:regulator of nucleoside diphosphate kinase